MSVRLAGVTDQPPYRREHTDADPSAVETERQPNRTKAVPTSKDAVIFLALAAVADAVFALIVAFALDIDWLGLVMAIIAVLIAVVAYTSSKGDQRAGSAVPGLALLACLIITAVVLLDTLDAEDAVPEGEAAPAALVPGDVEDAGTGELTDGDADLGNADEPGHEPADDPIDE